MYLIAFTDDQGSTGFPQVLPPSIPVKLCQYAPQTGDGETVTESLQLSLEGLPAQIESFMDQLTCTMQQAAVEADVPGGNRVYLLVRTSAAETTVWRSPLLGGRVLLGPAGVDQRGAGSQGLTLELTRADWWENMLPARAWLENAGGNNEWDALLLSNHADSGHYNSANLPAQHGGADNITGGLPPRVVLKHGLAPGLTQAVTLMVCQGNRPGVTLLVDTYQGEACTAQAGVTGTITADAGCANGNYLNLAWTGAQEQALFAFDLAWQQVQRVGGYPARLVLRLQDGLSTAASEKLWYRWRIYADATSGSLLAESSSQYMETAQELIFGPTLCIPPWLVDGSVPVGPSLRFVLVVQAAGTGAHALKLDSVTVAPCEGWRIYRPVNSLGSSGVVDDATRGQVLALSGFYQTHIAEGPGFTLYPGKEARFWGFVLRHDAGEKSAPIEQEQYISLEYYERRQTL